MCDSPDGKFSVRAGVPQSQTSIAWGDQYINVQIRNNLNEAVPVIWNYETVWGGSPFSSAGVLEIPSQRWGADNDTGTTWYNATGTNTNNRVYWRNIGIYDGTHRGPEYRRYTWIPQGANNNVSYEIHVMLALDTTIPNIAVAPSSMKCYIKLTQVTAAN